MDLALPRQPSHWYRILISEVEINSLQGAIITAGTIIVVGGLVNLGIVLAVAPIAATSPAKDAMDVEAIVPVLPNELREDGRFDEQEDRTDAIRPRRFLVTR